MRKLKSDNSYAEKSVLAAKLCRSKNQPADSNLSYLDRMESSLI